MNSRPGLAVLKEIGFTLLNEGKSIKLRADGFSMYPSIRPGSVICIEPVEKPAYLHRGEIIAWKRDSGFVAHRLVRKFDKEGQAHFVTRGDCNLHEDKPFTADIIAGKVIRVEFPEGHPLTLKSYMNKRPKYLFNRLSVMFRRFFKLL
jgi:signal peptidase I